MLNYNPLLDVLVELAGRPNKKRGHKYGLKAVHADFESSRGYVWPFPGETAKSPKTPLVGGSCPSFEGDGLCVALTAHGAGQGGHRLSTVLLVSYGRTFGSDEHKVRVGQADVLCVFDIPKLARAGKLSGTDLFGASLSGTDLSGANLARVNLTGASLCGVSLSGASLTGADLSGANLARANLCAASLSGANLSGANLARTDLYGAFLCGADLCGANLYAARLTEADLFGASLYGAILTGATGYKKP